ncbi:MAG: PIN domain-containing protein [Methylococcales bacterium]|nr:PIN domain-containing protein [Methylococcales bacterium]MDP3840740.1 PIN domain-containing protein [Methylococcales bacterium]
MTEQIARVLLIDLENCPSQINQLMTHLEKYSMVVVCYAQSGAKIPIDWLMPLTGIVNNKRLKWVKMPTTGKNAADFGITFWAGVLMAKLPPNTHFDIVSNDTDLDHVVGLLIDQKRTAERVGTKKEVLPIPTAIVTTKTDLKLQEYYLHEYCLSLINMKTGKPAKKETLLNSIKAKFKSDNIDAEQLVKSLIKNGIIDSSNENKIMYNEQKLIQLANTI